VLHGSEGRKPPGPRDTPILANGKDYSAPSVFRPEALLREARRQKQLPLAAVPRIWVVDPDEDLMRHVKRTVAARRHEGWACHHTELVAFDLDGVGDVGVVRCAVGASFAVLVAEQLFSSGCQFLVSITSAGQIADAGQVPYFVLIDRALRDDGTSYHYMLPTTFADAPDPEFLASEALAAIVRQTLTDERQAMTFRTLIALTRIPLLLIWGEETPSPTRHRRTACWIGSPCCAC